MKWLLLVYHCTCTHTQTNTLIYTFGTAVSCIYVPLRVQTPYIFTLCIAPPTICGYATKIAKGGWVIYSPLLSSTKSRNSYTVQFKVSMVTEQLRNLPSIASVTRVVSMPMVSKHCHLYCGLVSHGQTLFRTEGKGLGFGHRATCRPAPWSAYQSQHSIQSHDT